MTVNSITKDAITMNAKKVKNLLILLAILLTAYLSFLTVKYYGFLVRGILGLSVMFLLYTMVFTSIDNLSATVNNIRNPKKNKRFYILIFFRNDCFYCIARSSRNATDCVETVV